MNATECQDIAKTILAQLGGAKFVAMTGASSFSSGKFGHGERPGLSFRVRGAQRKIVGVIITLEPSDTYTMTFLAKSADVVPRVHDRIEDVYCDSLGDVFTSVTGLATHL